jgi:hypothetical protein
MQQVFINLFQSKARLMVIFRYLLLGAIGFMGIERIRFILYYLQATETYNNRDFLQYYLISKAVISGINPYLPIDKLAQIFIGRFPYFPHPAPCTPFIAILFIPFSQLNINQFGTMVFIFELILLLLIAYMLPILWNGKTSWQISTVAFIVLMAWYPVANDLLYGQLSILLAALLLVALVKLKKERKIYAGVLIGFTLAIKLITWPMVIYFIIKKDWRTVISSLFTAIGLNLFAAIIIGIDPFFYYYLNVSSQVFSIYKAVMHNVSLWTIGYRLFSGTGTNLLPNYISAPPLVYIPQIAFLFSGLLVITYLVWGLICASCSITVDSAFGILVCLILCLSPVTWPHYYVMLIIPLVVLFQLVWQRGFPAWRTLLMIIICLFLFLINEQLVNIILLINGGSNLVNANHNQITFASSLLSWLPIVEIIVLSVLLWQGRSSLFGGVKQLIVINHDL